METRPMIERLLSLAQFITHPNGMNVPRTARMLEVSPKTIHRDKDFLRDRLMVDMDYDHNKRVWRGQDNGNLAALRTINTHNL